MPNLVAKAQNAPSSNAPTEAPVYISGMPIEALVKALKNNQYYLYSQTGKTEDDFWASSPNHWATGENDLLDLYFDTPHLINAISFDVGHFPHDMRMFYIPGGVEDDSAWMPVKNSAGRVIIESVMDSVPAVITPLAHNVQSHPMHRGKDHWIPRSYKLQPILVNRLRIQFRRNGSKPRKTPVDIHGNKVQYGQAVRGLKVGYTIEMKSDVPKTSRALSSMTEREPFTSTTDILGSPVALSVRENRATDVLQGGVWKSEPQPVPNAVVNFYLDVRDGQGDGQTIDKLKVGTQTSGVSCNLYYSNDTPERQEHLPAADRPLGFPLTQGHGFYTLDNKGLTFSTEVGFITVDNSAIQFDANSPFTLGFSVKTKFDSSSDLDRPIFDSGNLTVTLGPSGIIAKLGSTSVQMKLDAFSAGAMISAVVYRTSGGEIKIQSSLGSGEAISPAPAEKTSPNSDVCIGGSPNLGLSCYSSINSVFIKVGEPSGSSDDYTEFFNNPMSYVTDEPKNDDMILRHCFSFMSSTTRPGSSYGSNKEIGLLNPFGFLGGVPDRYENLLWTPISQDYRLHSGYMHFPATRMKFIKMEFTNLAPAPYDDYSVQRRTVKLFPEAASSGVQGYGKNQSQVVSSVRPTGPNGNPIDSADSAISVSATSRFYEDQAQHYTVNSPLNPSSNYRPTTAVVSSDPELAAQIRSSTVVYNSLQPWHPTTVVPQFIQTQQHVYEQVSLAHTQKIAFFAGLTSIQAFRVDYTSRDDTGIYVEPFIGTKHIGGESAFYQGMANTETGWAIDTIKGGATSPGGTDQTITESTLTSVPFRSTRRVTAVQFATQQSDPVQLLPDSDISDTTLSHWSPVGDAGLSMANPIGGPTSGMGIVSRNSGSTYWRTIQDSFTSWGGFQAQGITWGDLTNSGGVQSPIGGIKTSSPVPVSSRGHVYAAARIYTTKPMTAPLALQITNGDGQVLAEEMVTPHVGQTVEWWTSLDLDAYANPMSARWRDVQMMGTWGDLVTTQNGDQATWRDVIGNSDLSTGTLGVQLIQNTPSTDEFHVDSIALFEDPLVWEFSRDGGRTFYKASQVRNNPDACMTFPDGVVDEIDGTSLVWRVTSMRPSKRVESLVIRPRYSTLPLGRLPDDSMLTPGAHISKADYFQEIEADPRWTKGFTPVPQGWWFAFRRWLDSSVANLGDSLSTGSSDVIPVTAAKTATILGTTVEPDYQSLAGDRLKLTADMGQPQEFRPAGQPAVAILSGGSYAVATIMVENVSRFGSTPTKGSFVRVWKISPDMVVSSTFDWQPTDPINSAGQVPKLRIVALDNDQIEVVLDDSFDSATTFYIGGAGGAMLGSVFFTAPGGRRIADSSLGREGRYEWFGESPYLVSESKQAIPGDSGGALSPADPGAYVCAQISAFTAPNRTYVSEVRISFYVLQASTSFDPSLVRWRITADETSEFIFDISGTAKECLVEQQHLREGGWQKVSLVLRQGDERLRTIMQALALGDVVLSVDPGGSDKTMRKVSLVEVQIDSEIGDEA